MIRFDSMIFISQSNLTKNTVIGKDIDDKSAPLPEGDLDCSHVKRGHAFYYPAN